MNCPKCGDVMNMCGVGGAFTNQLEFYICCSCYHMHHPFLDTKEKILTAIAEIDKEIEKMSIKLK